MMASETLLWSKIRTDYPRVKKLLSHRTNYNCHCKHLHEVLVMVTTQVSQFLCDHMDEPKVLINDSIPVEICKIVRYYAD